MMVDHQNSRSEIAALEMEPIMRPKQRQGASSTSERIDQLVLLIKLHIEYYPRVASTIAAVIVVILFSVFVLSFRKPVTRNRLYHDYSKIDMNYTFRATQINDWCLFGGNDDCKCDEFNEPMPRDEKNGWIKTHNINVRRIDESMDYDVVFYGDETAEGWNGTGLNIPRADGTKIRQYFAETFTRQGGGQFDGLPMGVMGDVSPNLLWRLRHGEMPAALNSKVYWLMTGINDLVRGGCSEEVTLLGILRLADEIYFHNPSSIIVIQGILPWTKNSDGSLTMPASHRPHIFGSNGHAQKAYSVNEAKEKFFLWPSIQQINSQLEQFCSLHEHLVYFDASALFLGSMGNEYYRQKGQHIITDLLNNGKRLTYDGYKVLGETIRKELGRIIYKGDEANDIEVKGGN